MYKAVFLVFLLAFLAQLQVFSQESTQMAELENLLEKAYNLKADKQFAEALIALDKGVSISSKMTETPKLKALFLIEAADVLWSLENFKKAIVNYEVSNEILQKNPWPEKHIVCLAGLGKLYLVVNQDTSKAINAFLTGANMADQILDTSIATYCYTNVVPMLTAQKQWKQAKVIRMKQLEIYKYNKDFENSALMYWFLAESDEALLNYDSAITNYSFGAKFYEQAGNYGYVVTMYNNIGIDYQKLGRHEEAIGSYLKALPWAYLSKSPDKIANTYWNIGYEYDIIRQYDSAIVNYNKAIAVFRSANIGDKAATLNGNVAKIYVNQGNIALAIQHYKYVADYQKDKTDQSTYAYTLEDIAGLYWKKLDYSSAKKYYNEILAIRKQLNDYYNLVYALVNVGSITSFADNNFPEAEKYFIEALKLCKETKNEQMTAFCYEKLAEIYDVKGKLTEYITEINKALAYYNKVNDLAKIALLKIKIGNFLTSKAKFDEAIKHYDEANDLAEKIPDLEIVASVCLSKAWIEYVINGDYRKGMDLLEKALIIYKSKNNVFGIGDVYHAMSNNLISFGNYKEAEYYLNKTDSIYKLLNFNLVTAGVYNTKGRFYFYQQDFQKSYESHKAGYDIRVKIQDLGEDFTVASSNVGECLISLKRYEEAIPYLQNSLQISQKSENKRGQASALEKLGEIRLEQKRYPEAAVYLDKALAILNDIKLQEHLAAVNRLQARLYYESNQPDKAIPFAEQTILISEKIGSDFYLWEALYIMGCISKDKNQLVKAKTYLKSAVEIIEKIRSRITGGEAAQKLFSSGDTKMKVYEGLIEVLLKMNDIDGALEYIEKNNLGDQNARFKNVKINYENSNKNKEREESITKLAKVEGLEKQLILEKSKPSHEQDVIKIEKLEKTKNIASNEYVSFVRKNIRVDADKYIDLRLNRGKIPKDMALVSYLPGENQLFIFVATSDSAVARVVTVSNAELGKLITYIRNNAKLNTGNIKNSLTEQSAAEKRAEPFIAPKQSDPFLKTLEKAYSYLIAPIQDAIKYKTKLAIMPADKLHFLPFQILGKTLNNGNFNFLIENYTIFYTKDYKMLNTEKIDSSKVKIIAFGNPDESLPASEKEVNLIQKSYPDAKVFIRSEASEDKAKNLGTEYNIAHFATHGNLNYTNPEESYLTMAKNLSKGEDGNLSLQDLWGLELMNHLNLVILSACNSAMSSDSEVPISPATGFFDNGVKAVIASLWPVNDEATATLMSGFYSNMGKMSIAEAFRDAQIKLTQNSKYRHPYYWAPFILQGDWK